MIDLAKVRNYYIACGYTDLRLGIDGLAAVVTQQYGSHLDSKKKNYVLGKDQLSLFNEAEKEQDHKAEEPTRIPFSYLRMNVRKNAVRPKC